MRKIFLLSALLLFAAHVTNAAEKIRLADLNNAAFVQKTIRGINPLDGDGESYAQISSDGKKIVKYSFKTGKQTGVIFDADNARGSKVDRVEGYIISPDGKRILIQTNTQPIYRHSFTAEYYIYTVVNNTLEPLSEGGPQQTPLFSPDGNVIAFVRDNNIFLVKLLYDNAESQVTTDGKRNEIINGIPDWVNEEEFSNDRAMVFTADSKMVCWIRYDESNVKEFSFQLFRGMSPEFDEYAEYPGAYVYKYPVPGGENASVSVRSFDILSHQTRTLQVPLDADGYIPRIVMTSNPEKIAVYTFNRHQDDFRIYTANPRSTVAQLIIQDKIDKYVTEESMENIVFTDKYILMPSERSGYNWLYLYNSNGQLLKTFGEGKMVVRDVYGFDEATQTAYFSATGDNETEQQIYCGKMKGGVQRLSTKAGWNSAIFSSDFKYYINVWSDAETPNVYTINNANGKVLTTLEDNSALKSKLKSYNMPKKEFFTFTTSEGVKLNGIMIKPVDFNASQKYPVVMFQYGGPGNQQVVNRWGLGSCGRGGIYEEYLAQEGYVVVIVDGRGTGGRGAEFEKCTYLRLGELEAKDQVEAAIYLGNLPYVDKTKIGIWGWSYGGWNTLMSMSEGRDVFAAGVAVAPPTCWRYYDSIYTERYMRTPKENKSGYDDVNPIARAGKLHGALLICHGLADDNVHYQNTAEYTEALVQADKDFQMNIYTNRNHGIFGGNTRNHLFRQITNWFNRNLK